LLPSRVGWTYLKSDKKKEEKVDESDGDKTDMPDEKLQVPSLDCLI